MQRKHWGKSVILKRLGNSEVVTLHLEQSETAWNPTSAKRYIRGLCVVEYRQFGDGGIDVRVKPG